MKVIDASAVVSFLTALEPHPMVRAVMDGDLAAPHLLDVEVLSALRGLVIGGKLSPSRARRAISDYFAYSIDRHEVLPLAARVWELRDRFTAYDANYLALAEALDTQVVTCDATWREFGDLVVHVG